MKQEFGFGREPDVRCESATESCQRADDRDSMFLQARILPAGKPDVVARVRNLSSGGMMVETTNAFVRGEEVQVELRSIGMVSARVAWVASQKVGLAFATPIDAKLARKAPIQSPGSKIMLVQAGSTFRRPGVK